MKVKPVDQRRGEDDRAGEAQLWTRSTWHVPARTESGAGRIRRRVVRAPVLCAGVALEPVVVRQELPAAFTGGGEDDRVREA